MIISRHSAYLRYITLTHCFNSPVYYLAYVLTMSKWHFPSHDTLSFLIRVYCIHLYFATFVAVFHIYQISLLSRIRYYDLFHWLAKILYFFILFMRDQQVLSDCISLETIILLRIIYSAHIVIFSCAPSGKARCNSVSVVLLSYTLAGIHRSRFGIWSHMHPSAPLLHFVPVCSCYSVYRQVIREKVLAKVSPSK